MWEASGADEGIAGIFVSIRKFFSVWVCGIVICAPENPYFRLVANRWNRIWRTRSYLYTILITYPQLIIFWVLLASKRIEVFLFCFCFFRKEIEVLVWTFLKTKDVSHASVMSCLDSELCLVGLGPTWTDQVYCDFPGQQIRKLIKDGLIIRKPVTVHSGSMRKNTLAAGRAGIWV